MKLLDRRGDIFNNLDFCRQPNIRQRVFFNILEANSLPYIHCPAGMADQQNQTPLETKMAAPNDKFSRSIGEISQKSVSGHHKERQDHESKAIFDKRLKQVKKLARKGK